MALVLACDSFQILERSVQRDLDEDTERIVRAVDKLPFEFEQSELEDVIYKACAPIQMRYREDLCRILIQSIATSSNPVPSDSLI